MRTSKRVNFDNIDKLLIQMLQNQPSNTSRKRIQVLTTLSNHINPLPKNTASLALLKRSKKLIHKQAALDVATLNAIASKPHTNTHQPHQNLSTKMSNSTVQNNYRIDIFDKNFVLPISSKQLSKVTTSKLHAFANKLLLKRSINTVRNYIKSLSIFFEFLRDESIITHNPAKNVIKVLPKAEAPKKKASRVPWETVILTITNTQIPLQTRAIFAIMFHTGMRVSEVTSLTTKDIMVYPEYTVINILKAKSGDRKQHVTGITKELLDVHFCTPDVQKRKWLFSTRKLRDVKLAKTTIYKVFMEYFGTSPHGARATACTRLLELNQSHEDVAKYLGHSSKYEIPTYDRREDSNLKLSKVIDDMVN